MRRMYSDGQVIKVVNKAIDDGEIQAGGLPEIEAGDAGKALVVNQAEDGVEWSEIESGGLTPEQEAKLNNSLQLPESAPAAQQLVGINTSGEQNALGIGGGLAVENNNLVTPNILTLDFAGTTNITVAQNIAQNIYDSKYGVIYVTNYSSSNYKLAFVLTSTGYRTLQNIRTDTVQYCGKSTFVAIYSLSASTSNYQVQISSSSFGGDNIYKYTVITGASGSLSSVAGNAWKSKNLLTTSILYQVSSSDPISLINWKCSDFSTFAIGFAEVYNSSGTLTATYKIIWNMTASTWTATAQ